MYQCFDVLSPLFCLLFKGDPFEQCLVKVGVANKGLEKESQRCAAQSERDGEKHIVSACLHLYSKHFFNITRSISSQRREHATAYYII